ncbi:MAG: HAD family hydrolase [Oscillospiraceae bacterium]|nr:HAD family hydrolase [Oscillospiraceae bacterium]
MGKHVAPEKVNTGSKKTSRKIQKTAANDFSSRVEPAQPNRRAETSKFRGKQLSGGIKNYISHVSYSSGEKDYSGDLTEMLILMAAFVMFDALMILKSRFGVLADYCQLLPMLLCLLPMLKEALSAIVEAYLTDVSIYVVLTAVVLAITYSCCAAAAFVLFWSLFRFVDHNIKTRFCVENAAQEETSANVLVLIDGGEEEEISPEDVQAGDVIRFKAGESICFDGIAADGEAEIVHRYTDPLQAKCTIQKGSLVLSGAYIENGLVDVIVQNPIGETFTDFVNNNALRKNGLGKKKEKIFKKLNTVFSILRAVLFGVVLLISFINHAWKQNFGFFAIYLIITGLDYLYLAECARLTECMKTARDFGAYFVNRSVPERFAAANTFVFGMTGTLTDGKYAVMEIVPFGLSKNALLTIAVAAERNSDHVIAQSLRNACTSDISAIPAASEFTEFPGQGVSVTLGGKHVVVGITKLQNSFGVQCAVPDKPGIAIHVSVDKQYAGYILLTDRVRDHAFEMIDDLRFRGAERAVMLTGNVPSAAKKVGIALNIDMIKSELSTEQKLTALEYLSASNREGKTTAFIGTKEDEQVLIEDAQVGIAVGGNSFQHIFSSADICFAGTDLMSIPAVYGVCMLQSRMVRIFEYIAVSVAVLVLLGAVFGIFKLGFVLIAYLILRIGLYLAACDGLKIVLSFFRKK